MRTKTFAFLFGCMLCSCGGTYDAGETEGVDQAAAPSSKAPAPIASLSLESGNVVEFYEFRRGVMVSESGSSRTRALHLTANDTPAQLVDIWRKLAPSTPVPQALLVLKDRLMNLPASDVNAPRSKLVARKINWGGPQESVETAASFCNNVCCDYDWVASQGECHTSLPHNWFYFDYGWSIANAPQIALVHSGVCSWQGTSTFHVDIDGAGGTWSVIQGQYRYFNWLAGWSPFCGGVCDEDMWSSVNSQAHQVGHAYCGGTG